MSGWGWLNFIAHAAWFGLLVYFFNIHGSAPVKFDALSATMTAMQLTLVVGGLFTFGYFRYLAEKEASRTAEETARRWMEERGPRLVKDQVDIIISPEISGETADEISSHVEENG